jgi:hypothetical protein
MESRRQFGWRGSKNIRWNYLHEMSEDVWDLGLEILLHRPQKMLVRDM